MNEQRKIETEEVAEPAKPPKARVDLSSPAFAGEGDQPKAGGGATRTP